jgi:hypothetical protein
MYVTKRVLVGVGDPSTDQHIERVGNIISFAYRTLSTLAIPCDTHSFLVDLILTERGRESECSGRAWERERERERERG